MFAAAQLIDKNGVPWSALPCQVRAESYSGDRRLCEHAEELLIKDYFKELMDPTSHMSHKQHEARGGTLKVFTLLAPCCGC